MEASVNGGIMCNKHTIQELKQWQALPLSIKVLMTQERIRNLVREYDESGVYLSFSAGKDSTVLAHISKHGKGKTVSDKVRNRMIAYNNTRKGTRQPFHRADISYSHVKNMLDNGYSLNKIEKTLGCDWSTVNARVIDLKNNTGLLESEE